MKKSSILILKYKQKIIKKIEDFYHEFLEASSGFNPFYHLSRVHSNWYYCSYLSTKTGGKVYEKMIFKLSPL